MPFHLVWTRDNTVLHGYDGGVWVNGSLAFPITYPGRKTDALPIALRSSAREGGLEKLVNVRFYLTGTDVPLVQGSWPYLGSALTPSRPELDGGFEISFDGGRSWTRFSKTVGYESDPATWLLLPKLAIGLAGVEGELGPFDQAHMLVRYTVPPQATIFKVLDIQLGVGCDIVRS